MRTFIGMVLALAFLLPGLAVIGAGFEMLGQTGKEEDMFAAFIMGGLLALVGIIIFFIVRGARKNRISDTDPTAFITTVTAMHLGNDFDGDSGSDGGD